MDPTRSVSSILTGQLLKLRNPQGSEENWLFRQESRGDLVVWGARVVAAEVGCALLLVTAAAESIVYGALGLVSLCFWCVNNEPAKLCGRLISSSGFTILWNIGNLTVFNACTNAVTHESFARYSMDEWPRGQIFKIVVIVADCVLGILSALTRDTHYPTGVLSSFILSHKFTRLEDSLYIADWAIRNVLQPALAAGVGEPPAAVVNPQLRIIRAHGDDVNQRIAEGTAFIQEHIFGEGKIDAALAQEIREYDPDALLFMLSRSVYLYTVGELRDAPIPTFFKNETQAAIRELRLRLHADRTVVDLAAHFQSIEAYTQEPQNPYSRQIFDRIKGIGYSDQQGGFLIGRCLQGAIASAA